MSRCWKVTQSQVDAVHTIIHTLLYLTAFLAVDEPRTGPPKDEGNAVRVSDLESLKPLPGTILVLCRELKDAIGVAAPEGVFLNAAKYQALQDRLEYLESQIKQALPAVPTVCRLSGQVDGDVARIQARFEFVTTRPRSTVTIGCQRAWLKPGATLDDKLPLLFATDDGTLKVQVEHAGIHTLKLDLDIPVAPRGSKRQEFGFDFGLPGAAITTVDQFTFPQSITEIRVNGRSNRTKPHDGNTSRLEGIALGPATQLAVAWRQPGSSVSEPAAIEAEGRIVVRIRDQSVITDVDMTLRPLGGEVRQWEILVPTDAALEIRSPRTPDDRVAGIDLPQSNSPKLTVRFHEPSAEPYKLTFQLRRTRSNGPIPIGPFRVLGALRERGTIVVSATPETLLRYRPRADVLERDLTDEGRRENGVAEFTYGNVAAASSEVDSTASLLTMEVDEQRGAVEARVEHQLSLVGSQWRNRLTIHMNPLRARIREFDIEMPPGFRLEDSAGAAPYDLIDRLEWRDGLDGKRIARVRLERDMRQRFAVSLKGAYESRNDPPKTALGLPRPLSALDRGGQVIVSTSDQLELIVSDSSPDSECGGRAVPIASGKNTVWQTERFPSRMDLAWRPKRPELSVLGVVDVSLTEESAVVKQRLTFETGGQPVRRIPVSVPRQIGDRFQVVRGGKITTDGMLEFSEPTEQQHLVEIEFECPARDDPASADAPSVPLISFPEATRIDVTVRVWTESGTAPVLAAGGPWRQQPIDSVVDRDAFPSLVARSDNLSAPLRLELRGKNSSLPPQMIERALVRVAISEDGNHYYRAQFLLRNLNSRTVEIELPRSESIEFFFDGRRLTRYEELPAEPGTNTMAVRVQIPTESRTSPGILEVRYQRTSESGSNRVGRSILHPPVVRGAVMTGRHRWEIDLPPSHLVVWNENATPINDWVFSGGLLTPRATFSANDLQAWLADGSQSASGTDGASFVFRQGLLHPMQIVYVHRQTWLIVCSLLFLAIVMAVWMAPLTPRARWMAASLLVALVLAVAVWRPQVIPALVYGCQPGVVALLLMVCIRAALRWRDRRRGRVLYGFRRDSTTPSPSRRPTAWHPAEASTIDSPPSRESALKHVAEGGAERRLKRWISNGCMLRWRLPCLWQTVHRALAMSRFPTRFRCVARYCRWNGYAMSWIAWSAAS